MTSHPLLTIIIAAHNCEKTIDATVESIVHALGPSIVHSEIIIINDASTDLSGDKISALAKFIPQISVSNVNYKNIGRVRQHGVCLSRGQYITMIDSDDLIKMGSLIPILDFLNEMQPDMLLTRLHEIRDSNKIDHKWSGLNPEKISQSETIKRFLIHKDLQAHLGGQFIKREIYLANEIPAMTCYEDFYVFPSMLMLAREIYFQRDSHYYYLKHSESLSATPNPDKISNLVTCTIRMGEVLPSHYNYLILCHWLDIYIKNKVWLQDIKQKNIVRKYVLMTHSLGFFLSTSVRLSYKRKALSTLWKN